MVLELSDAALSPEVLCRGSLKAGCKHACEAEAVGSPKFFRPSDIVDGNATEYVLGRSCGVESGSGWAAIVSSLILAIAGGVEVCAEVLVTLGVKGAARVL